MNTNEFKITAAYIFCQSQEEEIVPFILANDPIEFYIKRSKQKLLIKPVIHIVNRL